MGDGLKPLARKEKLVVQELNGEVLIYDLSENRAFCLNDTAAAVWQACDGENTIAEIGKKVGNEDLVWLALDQLKKEKLLENEFESKFAGMSRREAIKRVGLSSVLALPIISTLVAPVAAQTASTCQSTASCTCTGPNGGQGNPCTPTAGTACPTNCVCRWTNNGNSSGQCGT